MKKIAALALAAAMATVGVAAVSDSASAHPGPWMYPHTHFRSGWGGWGGRSNFYFGFGNPFFYLPPAPPPPPYGYYYYGGNAHVRWCIGRYRTYNPATDSFFIRPGVPARCIAPFDYGYGY